MPVYPQLSTGALVQYPLTKRREQRTITNAAVDGTSIKLADDPAATVQWRLSYSGLSDAELMSLQEFFLQAEGSLNGFTFLDPAGNLLAWSEDLKNPVWDGGPFLNISGQVIDPFGGTSGFRLGNAGAGPQSLIQTLNAPADYLYSLSIYARCTRTTTITLLLGGQRAPVTIGEDWTRVSFAAIGGSGTESITAGLEVSSGATVEVFGPQVEPQPSVSAYQKSTTGGIYENARFQDDSLIFTSTDVNRHSATVNIIYVNHL